MHALVDTHAFLWFVADDPRLSAAALDLMRDTSNGLSLSIASAWEIAIKVGRGRLKIDAPLDELFTIVPRQLSMDLLQIKPPHLVTVAQLPDHHRDPFDRLMVAQCLNEDILIISSDSAMDAYDVQRLW